MKSLIQPSTRSRSGKALRCGSLSQTAMPTGKSRESSGKATSGLLNLQMSRKRLRKLEEAMGGLCYRDGSGMSKAAFSIAVAVLTSSSSVTPLKANFWHLPHYSGEIKL